ncbi:MAG: hypothetical protein VX768_03735 [Planctomycetota bacterium]|nr:hypothetical protein [Planctomycetota bacterium]
MLRKPAAERGKVGRQPEITQGKLPLKKTAADRIFRFDGCCFVFNQELLEWSPRMQACTRDAPVMISRPRYHLSDGKWRAGGFFNY